MFFEKKIRIIYPPSETKTASFFAPKNGPGFFKKKKTLRRNHLWGMVQPVRFSFRGRPSPGTNPLLKPPHQGSKGKTSDTKKKDQKTETAGPPGDSIRDPLILQFEVT